MANWREVIEEGHVFYVSEDGNIAKIGDGKFVAIMPATVKLGPFDTVEQAQQAVEENKEALKQYIHSFNEHLLMMSKAIKYQ
jgi:hypothetical protein